MVDLDISKKKWPSYFGSKWWPGLGAMFAILPDILTQVAKVLIFARMLTQDVSRTKMGSLIEESI